MARSTSLKPGKLELDPMDNLGAGFGGRTASLDGDFGCGSAHAADAADAADATDATDATEGGIRRVISRMKWTTRLGPAALRISTAS